MNWAPHIIKIGFANDHTVVSDSEYSLKENGELNRLTKKYNLRTLPSNTKVFILNRFNPVQSDIFVGKSE